MVHAHLRGSEGLRLRWSTHPLSVAWQHSPSPTNGLLQLIEVRVVDMAVSLQATHHNAWRNTKLLGEIPDGLC